MKKIKAIVCQTLTVSQTFDNTDNRLIAPLFFTGLPNTGAAMPPTQVADQQQVLAQHGAMMGMQHPSMTSHWSAYQQLTTQVT